MKSSPLDGVTKFHARHVVRELSRDETEAFVAALLRWRQALFALNGIGYDPARYGGAGFGNVSLRVDATRFLISGSQTQGKATLTVDDIALVHACDVEKNTVESAGMTPPSSEALTHHAVYAADASVGGVVHVHAPRLFLAAEQLSLTAISKTIAYGTSAMARATANAVVEGARGCVMEGHEDGVVTWGRTLDRAGEKMLALYAEV